jgi:hypothetical protein
MKVVVILIPHVPWSFKQNFMSAIIVNNNIKETSRLRLRSVHRTQTLQILIGGFLSSGSKGKRSSVSAATVAVGEPALAS